MLIPSLQRLNCLTNSIHRGQLRVIFSVPCHFKTALLQLTPGKAAVHLFSVCFGFLKLSTSDLKHENLPTKPTYLKSLKVSTLHQTFSAPLALLDRTHHPSECKDYLHHGSFVFRRPGGATNFSFWLPKKLSSPLNKD